MRRLGMTFLMVMIVVLCSVQLARAATVLLAEDFNDITTLPASGWVQNNQSDPLGVTAWFQGDETLFAAQAGALPSYIAANYDNTSGDSPGGTISNWLLTPVLDFANVGQVSFWTRAIDPLPPPEPTYPDRLQIRLSTNGTSTNVGTLATDVGDFTTLLLEINPALTVVDYPFVWTKYIISSTDPNFPASGTGRIAFRYFVTDAGFNGINSDYIGIDTVEVLSQLINEYIIEASAGPNGSITPSGSVIVPSGTDQSFAITPAANYHVADVLVDGVSVGAVTNYTFPGVTAGHTIAASFSINTYTLTYTAGAGGSISGTTPQTVNHGASGTAVTAVPNTGYQFVDWSDGSTANPRTDTNVTANITVTANFAINTYTLTYTAGAGGSISGTTPQTVAHGADGTAVTAVPNTGYQFVDWSDGSTANPRTDTNVTANITVNANFAADIYSLNVVLAGSGSGTVTSDVAGINCQDDCTEVYDYGTVVILTAVPGQGSTFKGWTGDCTGMDTTCTVTIDQARNVTAEFYSFPWILYLPIIINNTLKP